MKQKKLTKSFILAISLLLMMVKVSTPEGFSGLDAFGDVSQIDGENLAITVNAVEYQITSKDKGQRIEMEGFGYVMVPGKPMLPTKNFMIALPPGARVQSVEVEGTGASQLPGTYQITPAPSIVPLVDPLQHPELAEKMQKEWQTNNQEVYSSDQAYPKERGRLTGSGTLRKYSYVSVSFYPFSYHPQSGRLIHYEAAQITVIYSLPSAGSSEAQRVEELRWDTVADEKASRLFVNYEQIKDSYQPGAQQPKAGQDT
jgi:hypothetical protein